MNHEATALKSMFSELITLDINRDLDNNYQLKQDAIENVWAVIVTLEKNAVNLYDIKTCIDELNSTLCFLLEIKTKSNKHFIVEEIERVIEMLEREIR